MRRRGSDRVVDPGRRSDRRGACRLIVLTPPDDPRTITLDQPIRNTKVHNGRRLAWTVGNRTVPVASLRTAPRTTGELDSSNTRRHRNEVSTALDQVEQREITLPEFQRGYVWNRDQVRSLIKAVYRRYPVGGLLVWETETDPRLTQTQPDRLGDGTGQKHLLLDGQQRVTTLYGVVRGRHPDSFREREAFTDLYFNLESESFQFYAPIKMQNDPLWIDVTECSTRNYGHLIDAFKRHRRP